MTSSSVEELLASIRRLPPSERRRLLERAQKELTVDLQTADTSGRDKPPSLLGLFADDPDLMDEICELAYQRRGHGAPHE